jgi:hypothetical protein
MDFGELAGGDASCGSFNTLATAQTLRANDQQGNQQ